MAKPRKTLQAKIRSLEENVKFWKAQADYERRQRLEKIDSYDEKLKDCRKRAEDAEWKFIRASVLWNKWVEADKGFDDGTTTREAFATWSKSDFQEILELMSHIPSN